MTISDYSNIEFGPIETKPKVNRIRTVKVIDSFVTFCRGEDYTGKDYTPRGEWLERLCEILENLVNNYPDVEITLFANGYQVDFTDFESEE